MSRTDAIFLSKPSPSSQWTWPLPSYSFSRSGPDPWRHCWLLSLILYIQSVLNPTGLSDSLYLVALNLELLHSTPWAGLYSPLVCGTAVFSDKASLSLWSQGLPYTINLSTFYIHWLNSLPLSSAIMVLFFKNVFLFVMSTDRVEGRGSHTCLRCSLEWKDSYFVLFV